jgi:hypothetical protein
VIRLTVTSPASLRTASSRICASYCAVRASYQPVLTLGMKPPSRPGSRTTAASTRSAANETPPPPAIAPSSIVSGELIRTDRIRGGSGSPRGSTFRRTAIAVPRVAHSSSIAVTRNENCRMSSVSDWNVMDTMTNGAAAGPALCARAWSAASARATRAGSAASPRASRARSAASALARSSRARLPISCRTGSAGLRRSPSSMILIVKPDALSQRSRMSIACQNASAGS